MGLAAGQARLLTITGRKSDCEFESMRLSHQKIALARQLADLSNEYQNSLTQTKLVYDYYGTGDTSLPLSYGILMQPSKLNDYMPTTITDSMGRVCLNSKYAAAAAAAGIPQEGLGTLPSEFARNQFIWALCGEERKDLASRIVALPYNQQAGFGGGATVAVQTQEMTLKNLVDYIKNNGEVANFDSLSKGANAKYVKGYNVFSVTAGERIDRENPTSYQNLGNYASADHKSLVWGYQGEMLRESDQTTTSWVGGKSVTLGEMLEQYLKSKQSYILFVDGLNNKNNTTGRDGIIDNICNSYFWDQMFDTFENLFNDGSEYAQRALDYARDEIEKMITNPSASANPAKYDNFDIGTGSGGCDSSIADGENDYLFIPNINAGRKTDAKDSNVKNWIAHQTATIGINVCFNNDNDGDNDNDSRMSSASINLSAMMMAYLTYFADFMNGVAKTDSAGKQVYEVKDRVDNSRLVDEDTLFNVKVGTDVSSDDLGQAQFYDALFNQICAKGWFENDNVTDNEYLKTMLQSGMMYITKLKDDGFYYQGNYTIDTYIKEIADESFVAAAEAKYNTEKAKLNAKEQTLDMKMKNLDTEISALTTEYDTVKNTISKQIEKSFKRYDA